MKTDSIGGKNKEEHLDDETFSCICKALAHPARVRILAFLKKSEPVYMR